MELMTAVRLRPTGGRRKGSLKSQASPRGPHSSRSRWRQSSHFPCHGFETQLRLGSSRLITVFCALKNESGSQVHSTSGPLYNLAILIWELRRVASVCGPELARVDSQPVRRQKSRPESSANRLQRQSATFCTHCYSSVSPFRLPGKACVRTVFQRN